MSGPYLTMAAYRAALARLAARDLLLVRYVAELRFVSGEQLARLCFEGTTPHAARQGLLRLTRLDVLARLPRPVGGARAGSAGFVYCLGPVGQRLAIERGWLPERRTRRPLAPGTLFVHHALMVSELHVRLIEADRRGDYELLTLQSEPACWRKGGSLTLKPDSYLRLGFTDFEDSYFVEVDRGTEGSRTIERQLGLYCDYYRSGREQAEQGVFPRVLWLVPDERREGTIADSMERLQGERDLFVVVPFDNALEALASPPSMT